MSARWYHDAVALNRRVAHGVTAVAAAAAVYEAVALAGFVIGRGQSPMVTPPAPRYAAQEAASAPVIDIAAAHLFGVAEADAAPTAVAQETAVVPETMLDLKLTGLLFGGEPQRRAAIIASVGQEKTYTVGDEIEGTGGAKVREVLAEGVLFDRQGATEMLRLVRYGAAEPRVAAAAGNATAPRVARSTQLRRNDYLRLMRKTEDGRLIGFAVMPGPNHDTFDLLGLQSNDVVTGIDGVALAERGGDSQLLERLAQGGSLTLNVLRSGASQEVRVDANRLPAGG